MVKTRWISHSSTTEEDTASRSSVLQRQRRKRKAEDEESDGSSDDSHVSARIKQLKTEGDTSSASSLSHRDYRNRKAEREDSDGSPFIRKKGRRLKAAEDNSSASSSSSQDENIFLKLVRKRKAEDEDLDDLFVKPTLSNIPQNPQWRATKKSRLSDEPTTSNGPRTSVQDSSDSSSRRRKDEEDKEEAPRPTTKTNGNPDAVKSPKRLRWRLKRRPVNSDDHPVLAVKGSSFDVFKYKYLKQEKIGQGGFGSVFAGVRKSDNLPVAIKYVKKAAALFSTVVGLSGQHYTIPTEVVLLLRAGGDSNSVGQNASVSLIEWFELENIMIIVMERPQNSINLMDVVHCYTGALSEAEAKTLIREIICATQEVMRKEVFHRDLKSSNILIQDCPDSDCGYKVRIVDFGCGSDVEALYEGMYVGTIEFAPPEYCIEGWYRAEPTCVWQLGALLCELMDPQGTFNTVDLINRKPKFKRGLSKDCRHFIKSCLKLMPSERLQLDQLLSHPWF